MDDLLAILRAAGEPTRLRILSILSAGEMTVSEMTQALLQSQPRISRHLKLLAEAGIVRRFPEGSWVFYRLNEDNENFALVAELINLLPENDHTILPAARRIPRQEDAHSRRRCSRRDGGVHGDFALFDDRSFFAGQEGQCRP